MRPYVVDIKPGAHGPDTRNYYDDIGKPGTICDFAKEIWLHLVYGARYTIELW